MAAAVTNGKKKQNIVMQKAYVLVIDGHLLLKICLLIITNKISHKQSIGYETYEFASKS